MSPPRLPTITGRGSTSVPLAGIRATGERVRVARCTPSVQRVRQLPAFANPDLDAARGCALAIRRRTRAPPTTPSTRRSMPGCRCPTCSRSSASAPSRGLVGTIDNLAGRVKLDGYLQPRAWQAGSGGSRSMGFGKQIGSGKAPRRARPLREGPSSRVRHALSPSEDPLRNEVERGSAHA